MAIRTRNKRELSFNFSSMSDLVFLLLIFFVLTSTLIAPNAIKLLLPQSEGKTRAKQTISVSITPDNQYYLGSNDEQPIELAELRMSLSNVLAEEEQGTVVVRSDKTVAVQYVVNIFDIVDDINSETDARHKVILATAPK